MATYDPSDPRWTTDPWPQFAAIREENPFHINDTGAYVLSRHADCLAVLRDRRASSDETNLDPQFVPRRSRSARVVDPDARPFLFLDPPDHTRLRGLVAKAFTPKMVAALRPVTESLAESLLDRALERSTVDFIDEVAYPLPVSVICTMLGVPVSDHEQFRTWSGALARGLDPEFLLSEEAIAERDGALANFGLYFAQLIEERRRTPGDDLLSNLVQLKENGDVLSPMELISTAILLLVAGHETTVNLISGGLLALLGAPESLQTLRASPQLMRPAVDEFVRIVSPVQIDGRILTDDIDVGPHRLERGRFVLLLIGAANRDPRVFAAPDDLVLDRSPNPHLGFGFGVHHCLGAPLARMETEVVLAALLKRTASITLVNEQVRYRPNVVLRGLVDLHVDLVAS